MTEKRVYSGYLDVFDADGALIAKVRMEPWCPVNIARLRTRGDGKVLRNGRPVSFVYYTDDHEEFIRGSVNGNGPHDISLEPRDCEYGSEFNIGEFDLYFPELEKNLKFK